jgi:hypothetical protein
MRALIISIDHLIAGKRPPVGYYNARLVMGHIAHCVIASLQDKKSAFWYQYYNTGSAMNRILMWPTLGTGQTENLFAKPSMPAH